MFEVEGLFSNGRFGRLGVPLRVPTGADMMYACDLAVAFNSNHLKSVDAAVLAW